MKKYKLLKDLPFAKAGDILSLERSQEYGYFKLCKDRSNPRSIELYEGIVEGFIDNFDEWFEEIEELKTFFLINNVLSEVVEHNIKYYKDWQIENLKSVGNYFETREEAEKYLEYLKAKAIIKQDTKGFMFDWQNHRKDKYYGYWNLDKNQPSYSLVYMSKKSSICFGNLDDIEESFKKHPEEWKTYLTYEQ